ncbi:lytic transglycosylase domain-containing protein [Clostridium sp. AL.422]|uniref:lytic transglycosylase domain-containing protein n=1 Tax=Clostridium TaxID=1485 RepID=UPI00293DC15B|nr:MULTISPECIES: lytic transglycosylase domain-containing protein [unclassified Clostridium]MDV4149404.1 lytic transglycosylase domain-containing protein [Clostridium sp. AL.422]
MNISKVEDFLGLTISKDVLKKAIGDGPEFDLVYETMVNSQIENMNSEENQENKEEESYSYTTSGSGQRLDDIPLRMRTTPIQTGELVLESTNTVYNNVGNSLEVYSQENSSVDMDKIYNAVDKYSSQYGVDKKLVLAIIKQESNFNPNAVSSAGAKGLMQLMDFNSKAYGVKNPFDIDENINAGVKHIKSYLDLYNGNVEMALMAYNAGPGTVQRRGVSSPSDLYKMPEETQNYVPKIMGQLV